MPEQRCTSRRALLASFDAAQVSARSKADIGQYTAEAGAEGDNAIDFRNGDSVFVRVAYLSTVLDDFSRYIMAWKLRTNMCAEDVTDTLDLALAASGCDSATVLHKLRLLSDYGLSYIAGELAEYIEANQMSHVRGAPMHP